MMTMIGYDDGDGEDDYEDDDDDDDDDADAVVSNLVRLYRDELVLPLLRPDDLQHFLAAEPCPVQEGPEHGEANDPDLEEQEHGDISEGANKPETLNKVFSDCRFKRLLSSGIEAHPAPGATRKNFGLDALADAVIDSKVANAHAWFTHANTDHRQFGGCTRLEERGPGTDHCKGARRYESYLDEAAVSRLAFTSVNMLDQPDMAAGAELQEDADDEHVNLQEDADDEHVNEILLEGLL
eukprot:12431530-Karenia_brevis.AAC.2